MVKLTPGISIMNIPRSNLFRIGGDHVRQSKSLGLIQPQISPAKTDCSIGFIVDFTPRKRLNLFCRSCRL